VEPLNASMPAGRLTLLEAHRLTHRDAQDLFSKSGGTPYGAHALNNDPNAPASTVTSAGSTMAPSTPCTRTSTRQCLAEARLNLAQDATLTSISAYDYGYWYEEGDDGGLPILCV
jgi:hypothetical protein